MHAGSNHIHSDRYAKAREVRLRSKHLLREDLIRQHLVEQWLRSELQHACDELGPRVRVQRTQKNVAPRLPDVAPVETELLGSLLSECNGWLDRLGSPISMHERLILPSKQR